MTIVKLSDYAKKEEGNIQLSIIFFGPKFLKEDGSETSVNIKVNVENGDVVGILDAVKEEGGVGHMQGKQYVYLPWPCACVVMHIPGDVPFEIDDDLMPESED